MIFTDTTYFQVLRNLQQNSEPGQTHQLRGDPVQGSGGGRQLQLRAALPVPQHGAALGAAEGAAAAAAGHLDVFAPHQGRRHHRHRDCRQEEEQNPAGTRLLSRILRLQSPSTGYGYLISTHHVPGSTFSPGAYSDSIIVEAQCEREKFSAAVSFLSDVLTYPHFTGLKVSAANRLIGVVVQSQRRRFHI